MELEGINLRRFSLQLAYDSAEFRFLGKLLFWNWHWSGLTVSGFGFEVLNLFLWLLFWISDEKMSLFSNNSFCIWSCRRSFLLKKALMAVHESKVGSGALKTTGTKSGRFIAASWVDIICSDTVDREHAIPRCVYKNWRCYSRLSDTGDFTGKWHA